MIRVVVESPFGRNVDDSKCTPAEYARNIRYLDRCLADCLRRLESPYASHRFFPGILDDTNPEERKLGIDAGLEWGACGKKVAVYIDHGITDGIRTGIARYTALGIPVETREIGREPDVAPVVPKRLHRVAAFMAINGFMPADPISKNWIESMVDGGPPLFERETRLAWAIAKSEAELAASSGRAP